MTQEERQLLIKDLCARLSYSVICCVTHKKNGSLVKEDMKLSGIFENGNFYFLDEIGSTYSDDYIPYLRPMSSMTEGEKDFIRNKYFYEDWDSWSDLLHYHYHLINIKEIPEFMEWIYTHHLDYSGLIEKGLALEATTNMYNIKN